MSSDSGTSTHGGSSVLLSKEHTHSLQDTYVMLQYNVIISVSVCVYWIILLHNGVNEFSSQVA